MARKEQIPVTLDPLLLSRLREIAKKRGESLSSVIEDHLREKSKAGQSDEVKQVLDILSEIKSSLPEGNSDD
jgi:hypothetical protein